MKRLRIVDCELGIGGQSQRQERGLAIRNRQSAIHN